LRRTFERELLYGDANATVSALLESLGLTQRELADRLGLSEARVSRILNARDNTTLKTLADLGWSLGVRFTLVPVPFADRADTPAANDPPPPKWLARQARLVARHKAVGPPSPPHGQSEPEAQH
jgi:transcriptional regulator with XRE-family HTH domain